MRTAVLALFILFSALPVAAETEAGALPAFFSVTGVAHDDVLNIREAPGTDAQVIGKLSAQDRNIEIVALNETGDWGQVTIGERSGWVSMRFLARQPGQPGDSLPTPLACVGTEPFWALSIDAGTSAELSRPGEDARTFGKLHIVNSSNRTDRYAIFGEGSKGLLTLVFHRAMCSDGMSDRTFGISVDMFLTTEIGVAFMSGCCSLAK